MVTNSIAAELLQQVNLTKLHPNPNYLSAADSISIDEFEQTEYSLEYTLDTLNIQWGSAPNDSHIFDIFCEFRAHRDSVKTRLEMLWFVAENTFETQMGLSCPIHYARCTHQHMAKTNVLLGYKS